MGRRAHKPDPTTRWQVEAMTAYGVPKADVARVLRIAKQHRDELLQAAIIDGLG